ncbi:Protein chup1, chloroplastic [Stylosanthes scabra]|uniref:Protein chup1, chloroplastic n=1 Tax=Stylosanthes scabra TaxID=79078 RepID=A0ABU6VM44_9FABA|nr:Protein chup1, chloroplastic [Stylosanthes scabra]
MGAALVGGGVTRDKATALGRGEVTWCPRGTSGGREVERITFTNIEEVVPFVEWLDDELSYLVDERAVLKHFEWPEQKANALRENAFGFSDLKKLGSKASSFRDDPRQPCAPALKKMQVLLKKYEHF